MVEVPKTITTHKNIICDGCETSPINGACYKCSVCQDFDFCENCEKTKSYPNNLLKINNPKLRPQVIITTEDFKDKF